MENKIILNDIIKQGIEKRIISFNEDYSRVKYTFQNKERNYNNPEEKVQVESFCKLVLEYNYPEENIDQFVKVTTGSTPHEADIIVYSDNSHKKPYIVVECKKSDVTEQEFKQAINQAFSYAYGTAGTLKYVWTTSGIKNEYYIVDQQSSVRESIADIPMCGTTKISTYKYGKNGGVNKDGNKVFPLQKIEESELTSKFKQAHQALWGGGELNPSEAFDELDKLIFCKIFDEKKKRKNSEPYDFQIIKVMPPENATEEQKKQAEDETTNNLLKRLHSLYEEGKILGDRKDDPEIFKDGIKLNAKKARTVVGYLEDVDLLHTDLDSKGRAFETFMGSFFRGDFGQYFTPRKIVSFIVDSLPITEQDRVLDTSCGSGGFLLHALDKVRKDARKFFDIKDGQAETRECHNTWHDFAENNLYGIEINEQIARTAKMNMIIHDDGHTNVVACDGLVSPSELRRITNNSKFKDHSFDYIITNPPFGSTIKQTEKAYMHQYSLATKDTDWLNPSSKASDRPSQSTEVMFIEQAEKYLNDGGYLAVVIPDGILTNSSMQYVRDYISETFRIVSVVSMPQTAFVSNGAGVKSSVMFLKKYSEAEKENRVSKKTGIKDDLIENSPEGKDLYKLLDEKKKAIAKINKEIKQAEKHESLIEAEELKEKKTQLTEEYDEKIEKTRELLSENFDVTYKKALNDYPIFMAIAENIGYDATGKETGINELDDISIELSKFINAIEKGEDSFFL